jgi:hypothetical protein
VALPYILEAIWLTRWLLGPLVASAKQQVIEGTQHLPVAQMQITAPDLRDLNTRPQYVSGSRMIIPYL